MPLGGEAAGTVVEVGAGVTTFKVGDRVAFNGVPGAYAELVAAPAARLVRIPDNVTTKQAAAALLQGMTAHYLAYSTYPLGAHDTCLVHAAAGGVGLLLCQIAKQRGARVIGTVSTEAKAKAAREAGASEVILYTQSRLRRGGRSGSRTAAALTWSTTASARPPLPRAWTACARAA